MDAEPKRAWWRKKRWIAGAVVALAACYPLSLGPMVYAAGRGWVSAGIGETFYAPIIQVLNEVESLSGSAEVEFRAELPDGRVVTSRGQALDAGAPWWVPAASAVVRPYMSFVSWCGEAGVGNARED